MALTERQKEILNLLISLYAREHSPIGSKALMDSVDASSATIRNDMKALEELGLIQKEHTSSGRVPSISGYKYYVENILQLEEMSQNELFKVMQRFDGDFYRLTDLFRAAADTLSELTGLTSFVLNVAQQGQTMLNFDIVLLDSHSALAIYTLSTGEIRTNQFIVPRSLDEDDLVMLKTIVIDRLLGKKIIDIHYALRTEIPQVISQYFSVTADVLKLFDVIFDGLFTDKVIESGAQKVFENESEMALAHYKLFSNSQLMAQEIRRLTADDALRAVKFENNDTFKGLTLISQKFLIPYRGFGTLALVGPIELDYQQLMTTMDLVAKVVTMKLTDYYRYLDGNHYEIT